MQNKEKYQTCTKAPIQVHGVWLWSEKLDWKLSIKNNSISQDNWIQKVILDWILDWKKKKMLKGHHWENWWNWNMHYRLCSVSMLNFLNLIYVRKDPCSWKIHTEKLKLPDLCNLLSNGSKLIIRYGGREYAKVYMVNWCIW